MWKPARVTTRRDKPVARLVPVTAAAPDRLAAIRRLRRLGKTVRMSTAEILEARRAGAGAGRLGTRAA